MNKTDYDERMKALEDEFKEKKKALCIVYCNANNAVKVGDIITNTHGESIRVDKVTFTFGYGCKHPECLYHGAGLKKDLSERKDGRRSVIYQSNLGSKP